jgi:hypothetical protein
MDTEKVDQRRTKEAKARATWKYLIHASREKMSLDEFTEEVNRHQGGAYFPFEFRKIHSELQAS